MKEAAIKFMKEATIKFLKSFSRVVWRANRVVWRAIVVIELFSRWFGK